MARRRKRPVAAQLGLPGRLPMPPPVKVHDAHKQTHRYSRRRVNTALRRGDHDA